MAPVPQREWLEAFIELYKSEPCLWKIKSTEYYDRNKKDAAYEKLVNKLREIESTATRETVIKKINNLRCTYKKEYKKVVASKANLSETVYEPKLWYYSLLSFLDSQEASRTSGSDFDKTLEMNQLKLHDVTSGSGTDTEQTTIPEEDWKYLRVKGRESTEPNGSFSGCATDESYMGWSPKTNGSLPADLKESMTHCFNTPVKEDRTDIVGRLVTLKLRDLSKEQALLAEKLINEALFKAEMGQLTTAHCVEAADASSRVTPGCALCDAVLRDLPVPVLELGALEEPFYH